MRYFFTHMNFIKEWMFRHYRISLVIWVIYMCIMVVGCYYVWVLS